MEPILEECQQALGVRFRDAKLLLQALTHASTGEGTKGHNERLEFLGDAVLTLIITDYLYVNHPQLTEGDMTELKGAIVSGSELAMTGTKLGLEKWVQVGKGISKASSIPRSILANTFEAITGALYLDQGFEACRRFALTALQEQIGRALQGARNYKMMFQNYAQKTFGEVPIYKLLDRGGPAFARSFQVSAMLKGIEYPAAWGKSKKEAEQWAAREALLAIEAEAKQKSESRDSENPTA